MRLPFPNVEAVMRAYLRLAGQVGTVPSFDITSEVENRCTTCETNAPPNRVPIRRMEGKADPDVPGHWKEVCSNDECRSKQYRSHAVPLPRPDAGNRDLGKVEDRFVENVEAAGDFATLDRLMLRPGSERAELEWGSENSGVARAFKAASVDRERWAGALSHFAQHALGQTGADVEEGDRARLIVAERCVRRGFVTARSRGAYRGALRRHAPDLLQGQT